MASAYFVDDKGKARGDDSEGVPIIKFGGPNLRACVAPSRGAELCSLEVFRPRENIWLETLHCANDFTTQEGGRWSGKSPILWPAVGRNFTASQLEKAKESGEMPSTCQYTSVDGSEFEIPLHGFVQKAKWRVASSSVDQSCALVILECTPDCAPESSNAQYPFAWHLSMELCVSESALSVRLIVENKEGAKDLPFSIGTHPTFRLPFSPDFATGHDSAYLQGTHAMDMKLSPFSCLTGESLDFTERTQLPAIEFCDNVIGKSQNNTSAENYMELVSPNEGIIMKLSQRLGELGLEVAANCPLYFVLWADASQRFFCLEPWCGGPNSLNTHEAVHLAPGKRFDWIHKFEPRFD